MNLLTSELEKLKGITSDLMDTTRATDAEIKKLSVVNALEQDPDPKIRTYTYWALERLRAKELI